MKHIFISHSTKNDSFVNEIAPTLRRERFRTWVDHADIVASQNWIKEVDKALKNASALLLVLTKESVESDNVEVEWSYCLDEKIPIYPILLDPEIKNSIPFRLRPIQYVDFTDASKREDSLQTLILGLSSLHVSAPEVEPFEKVSDPPDAPSHYAVERDESLFHTPEASDEIVKKYVESMRPIPPENPKFFMAPHYVTNRLYACFLESHPYWKPDDSEAWSRGDIDEKYLLHWVDDKSGDFEWGDMPVTHVNFQVARAFSRWLGNLTGHIIDLPTFEEWSIAVSSGRDGWFDDEINNGRVNYIKTAGALRPFDYASPNPFGIRDLLGNAYDMCVKFDKHTNTERLLLVGGCYYNTRNQLQERVIVLSPFATPKYISSFRCIYRVKDVAQ